MSAPSAVRRRFFRNTASNLAGTLFSLLVWFFLTPLLTRHLEPRDYGLWVLATAAVTYATFLNFGSGPAVTTYVAEYRARGDWKRCREVVGTAFAISIVTALAVIVVSGSVAIFMADITGVATDRMEVVSWLVILTGLWVAITLPALITLSVLRGLQRFDLINMAQIGSVLTLAVLMIVVLALGGDVIAVVSLGAPMEAAVLIVMTWMIRRAAPELRFPSIVFSRAEARSILSFGSAQFPMQAGTQVRARSGEFIVAALLPIAQVGPYSIARRLSELSTIVSSQLEVLTPLSSELSALNDDKRQRIAFTATTRIALASTAMLGTIIIMLGPEFLRLWVGPAFAADTDLLVIFVATALFAATYWPAQWMLIGMRRQRVPAVSAVASALIAVSLAIPLGRSFGTEGVASGVLIATAVGGFAIILPHGLRTAGVGARDAWTHIALPAITPLLPVALLGYGLRELTQPTSIPAIVGLASVLGIAYFGLYVSLPGTEAERAIVRAFLSSLRRRRALRVVAKALTRTRD
jgi:O-antigen/teichoic acid export membrane protein